MKAEEDSACAGILPPSRCLWNQVFNMIRTIKNLADGRDFSSAADALKMSTKPSKYSSTFMLSLSMTLPNSLLGVAAAKYILIKTTTAYATRTKWATGRHRTVSASNFKKVSNIPSIDFKQTERALICAEVSKSGDSESLRRVSSVNGGLNSSTLWSTCIATSCM